MTVEEMKEAIKNKCINTDCDECCLCPLYENKGNCYEGLKSEEIKRNYKLMFGKEELEMKNEFDFNELKAGWAIKVPMYDDELLVGIPYKEGLVFYSKNFNIVVSKEEILGNKPIYETYIPIEVYGFSSNADLFDPSTRPLLWKKEDINQKKYEIGDLKIYPNFREGYIGEDEDDEGIIYIEENRGDKNYPDDITIKKSELNDVINALTEIRDFIIKED